MTEPQDITRNPDDSVTRQEWSSSVAPAEPALGKKQTGWQAGDTVDEATFDWLSYSAFNWLRALFSRYPQASERFFTSWLVRNGIWVDGTNPLEGYLSDSGMVDSKVADVWLDPPSIDTGAVRVQISIPLASPHTFPATRDTFVFAPIDMTDPPYLTEPELTYLDVPVGDPQPATPAGTVPVWRVETDGSSIVDQEVLVFPIPVFKNMGFEQINTLGQVEIGGQLVVAGMSDLQGDVDVDGTFRVINDNPAIFTGNVTLGDAPADAVISNGTTTVTATFNANGNVNLGNNDGDIIDVGGGASDVVNVLAPSSFQDDIGLGNNTGVNVDVGGGASDTVDILAPSTVSETMSVEAAFNVLGASGGSISSDPSATLDWNGTADFIGRLIVTTATSVAAGDLSQDGSNNLRWRDSVGTKRVHYTTNGYVLGIGPSVSGTALNGVATGDLSSCSITAITTGIVLVRASGNIDHESDTGTLTVRLRDVTAGLIINGAGGGTVERAIDIDSGATSGRDRSICVEFAYTLPATGARTFAVDLLAGGANCAYVDVTVSVHGVT